MRTITSLSTAIGLALTLSNGTFAANHREAPITALDHKYPRKINLTKKGVEYTIICQPKL